MGFLDDPEIHILVLILAGGFWSILFANRQARAIERRMQEGDDRYFEEQRFYNAYRSTRNPKWIRRKGFIIVVMSLVLIAMKLWRGT